MEDNTSKKEEEDKAWWSDYQASTKLRRKWVQQDKSDIDDFDDLLGDLDDIVKRPDFAPQSSSTSKQHSTEGHRKCSPILEETGSKFETTEKVIKQQLILFPHRSKRNRNSRRKLGFAGKRRKFNRQKRRGK